jgi:hypothetical protein
MLPASYLPQLEHNGMGTANTNVGLFCSKEPGKQISFTLRVN